MRATSETGPWLAVLLLAAGVALAGDPFAPPTAPRSIFVSRPAACLIDDLGRRTGCLKPAPGLLHRVMSCVARCPDGRTSQRFDCDDPSFDPCGGGASGPAYAPDPFAERRQHYAALLDRARRLVGDLSADASSDAALDQRLSELDDRLEPVYAAAWRRWAGANAEMAALGPATKRLEALSDSYAMTLSDTAAPDLAKHRAEADALEAQRDAARAAFGKIVTATDYYRTLGRAQMGRMGRWINVVLPRSARTDDLRPQVLPLAPLEAGSEPPSTPAPPHLIPAVTLRPAIPPPPSVVFTGAPPPRPALPADVDGRLTLLESRVTATAEAVDGANASEAEVASTLERYRQDVDGANQYITKLDQAEGADADALTRAWAAEHQLDDDRVGVRRESAFLFSDAAREFVQETFRKHVVEPELKRMVLAAYVGRPPYELTGAFVEEAWSSHKLHLFSLVETGETAADAHALVKRTLDLVDNGEAAVNEAARLLATADPAEAQAFADDLGERLGSNARSLAAEALKTADIPQPYKVFWLKYFVGD